MTGFELFIYTFLTAYTVIRLSSEFSVAGTAVALTAAGIYVSLACLEKPTALYGCDETQT